MLTTFDSRVFRVGRRVDVQYDVWLLLLFRWLGIRWVLWMVDGSCGWSEEIRWVELRFSPSRDPICPSYPIIAWDAADSRGSLRNIVEPSYPVGYIGSLYLLDGSGWPLSPPLLQTCLLQSSSLLPHVYRRGIALLRHDAVSFLFFPPAALRMVSCGCFPCRCLFFSNFAAAPQYASPCPKLAQAFPIANILGVYTIHFLQLLARTAYARSCKRMTTFDGLLLSSCPGMCM